MLGDCWSVLICNVTEFPGFSGLIALNTRVVCEVFTPDQLLEVKDLKVPALICKINETTFDVLSALLLTESVVTSPVLVVVTVTNEGDALICCTVNVVNMLLRSRATRIADFNNTLLIQ
jgi:hypothetical protein